MGATVGREGLAISRTLTSCELVGHFVPIGQRGWSQWLSWVFLPMCELGRPGHADRIAPTGGGEIACRGTSMKVSWRVVGALLCGSAAMLTAAVVSAAPAAAIDEAQS